MYNSYRLAQEVPAAQVAVERRPAKSGSDERFTGLDLRTPRPVSACPHIPAGYEGSCVQEMNLETMQALHRLSYGHRNPRSMLVVVYDPQDPVCKDAELEVSSHRT